MRTWRRAHVCVEFVAFVRTCGQGLSQLPQKCILDWWELADPLNLSLTKNEPLHLAHWPMTHLRYGEFYVRNAASYLNFQMLGRRARSFARIVHVLFPAGDMESTNFNAATIKPASIWWQTQGRQLRLSMYNESFCHKSTSTLYQTNIQRLLKCTTGLIRYVIFQSTAPTRPLVSRGLSNNPPNKKLHLTTHNYYRAFLGSVPFVLFSPSFSHLDLKAFVSLHLNTLLEALAAHRGARRLRSTFQAWALSRSSEDRGAKEVFLVVESVYKCKRLLTFCCDLETKCITMYYRMGFGLVL